MKSPVYMNRGGMAQDAMQLQAAGTGDHNRLVHMTQPEVDALNTLASTGIGGLRANGMAINPETGLPEAGLWSNILPMIAGLGLTFATGGAAAPWMMGLAGAGGSLVGQAIEGDGIDVGRMFLSGLGAWGAGELSQVLGGATEAANAAAIAQPSANVVGGQVANVGANVGTNVGAGAIDLTSPAVTGAFNAPNLSSAAITGADQAAMAGWGTLPNTLDANIIQGVPANAMASNVASNVASAPSANTAFTGLLDRGAVAGADRAALASQLTTDPGAAYQAAGQAAYAANPSFDSVITGATEHANPLQWASTPSTVGLQDMVMPGGAAALGAAQSFGLFDQPEYNWDELDSGIGSYDYRGPYLPRSRTPTTPPEGFEPGVDPQYQYFSYANNGGYVGELPTIRAQSGYEPVNMQRSEQQQQPGSVFNKLAEMGASGIAGLGSLARPNGLGSLARLDDQRQPSSPVLPQPRMAQNRPPRPIYTSSIPSNKLPMLSPQQTAMAANGGAVGNLIDPQYRWSDAPNPAHRERVYRMAEGGLVGIDPQYRWSDTANPDMREHLYHPTVRAEGGKKGDESPMKFLEYYYNGPGRSKLPPYYKSLGENSLAGFFKAWKKNPAAAKKHVDELRGLMEQPVSKANGGMAGIDPQYRWSDVPNPADREHLYRKAFGGVAGEPSISETGIMEVSTPDMQEAVAERAMVVPAPEQPQNPAERVVFDQAVLALQGELDPEPAQAAITEFIDVFGPEAFRQLQVLVGGERENGGLVETASGQDTTGMTEGEVKAQQGPDVIPGKIVEATTGKQIANLLVGEKEFITPADAVAREAIPAGLPPTPENGAMVMGQRQEELKQIYG
tara:strand:+ start:2606 stop:5146 length:2541 start_codon:yes stop_codon:yes gene_type:complete